MRRLSVYFVLFALIASLASCSVVEEKEKERAAIKDALQKYLSERSGINLSAMDWTIKNLNTDRDSATVQVIFTAKQSGASTIMDYQLLRVNGVWTVQKSGVHGGAAMPVEPGTQASPPANGAGTLPPGHPPISAQPKAPAKPSPPPKKPS